MRTTLPMPYGKEASSNTRSSREATMPGVQMPKVCGKIMDMADLRACVDVGAGSRC